MKQITSKELEEKFDEIIDDVAKNKTEYLVTDAKVVLVPYSEELMKDLNGIVQQKR